MMVHTGRASGVVALDLTSVPMLVSDTVTNGFEFSVTRERFRPAGTSADRDCSRSSPASRCRTSHGPAGSISEAHGLQMSRIPPRAPFPNGIARGRRCRLRSKFAADSLLEETVLSELVSEPKFPGNRQKYRDFHRRSLRIRLVARNQEPNSVIYDPIPYSPEQGSYFGLAGN